MELESPRIILVLILSMQARAARPAGRVATTRAWTPMLGCDVFRRLRMSARAAGSGQRSASGCPWKKELQLPESMSFFLAAGSRLAGMASTTPAGSGAAAMSGPSPATRRHAGTRSRPTAAKLIAQARWRAPGFQDAAVRSI